MPPFKRAICRNKPCWAGSWEGWRRRYPSRPSRTIAPGAHRGACSRKSLPRIGEEFNRRTPAGSRVISSSGADHRPAWERKPSAIMRCDLSRRACARLSAIPAHRPNNRRLRRLHRSRPNPSHPNRGVRRFPPLTFRRGSSSIKRSAAKCGKNARWNPPGSISPANPSPGKGFVTCWVRDRSDAPG